MIHAPGNHDPLGLYGCDGTTLKDGGCLKTASVAAVWAAEATILTEHFHIFGDADDVADVLLLTKSHISIHT